MDFKCGGRKVWTDWASDTAEARMKRLNTDALASRQQRKKLEETIDQGLKKLATEKGVGHLHRDCQGGRVET